MEEIMRWEVKYHPRLPSLILREKQAEGDAGMSNGHLL
jgi:hypothetical protein